jgi:ABC-type multidrug transport system fused ATPase/permease subunit
MDKTLKTIRTDLLNSKLSLKRNNGRWYQYNWIDDAGNVLGQFDFKSSVPELYDAIKNKTIVPPNAGDISSNVSANISVESSTLNHLSSAQPKVIPMQKPIKKQGQTVSEQFTQDAPSVAEIFSKEPPKIYNGFYFPEFTPSLFRRIKTGKNIFLAGESGTGKSELVQKLAEYYGINKYLCEEEFISCYDDCLI